MPTPSTGATFREPRDGHPLDGSDPRSSRDGPQTRRPSGGFLLVVGLFRTRQRGGRRGRGDDAELGAHRETERPALAPEGRERALRVVAELLDHAAPAADTRAEELHELDDARELLGPLDVRDGAIA